MKTTVAIIAALVAAEAFAQCPTLDTAAVVTVDSVTAADLYARANKWFADAFKDANEVIQYKDQATHTVSGKGVATFAGAGYIHYTVEIACKDGRYRYEIKDVYHDNPSGVNVGTYYSPISMGAIYDCELCTASHAQHKAEHPKQTAVLTKNAKLCKEKILPICKGEINALIASITAGMASPTSATKDW